MLDIADEDIGGARVRRAFTRDGVYIKAGTYLSREEVLSIKIPNRRALSDSNFLEIFPNQQAAVGSERFLISTGEKDRFNVIEGRVLNDAPLARKEADRLLKS